MLKIFEKWKEDRRKQDYEEGFAWTCAEHLRHGVKLNDVRDKIAMEFATEFDRGAFDALRVFECNQAALEAANHNFEVAKNELSEAQQSARTLHKKCQDLNRSGAQYRAEIAQYKSDIAKYKASLQNQENEIGHYRTALASIQTKCKTILHDLPTLVHEPEYSFNDEYNQVRSEADDCAS